ncbi:hypothetical protein CK505_17035 [Kocuria sp. WN036]|nr:hypothetical protein CK505_17035 [Kocuria sp. WN036]
MPTVEGEEMKHLALVSAVQLGLGLAGLRQALRDRVTYDVGVLRGSPERIGAEQWLLGTGLSASGLMLALQAVCTAQLLARPRRRAARVLGVLGAVMVLGYPAERSVRAAWRQWDPRLAPMTVAATALAAVMAVLGLGRLPQDLP